MAQPIEFSNQADAGNGVLTVSQTFQDIKEAAHEHLLTHIEELGAEFDRWLRTAIRHFVDLEVEGFTCMRHIPVSETEIRQITGALTRELAGFDPIEDLLADPAVEDILVSGHLDVYVSRHGILGRILVRFADNSHLLRIVRRILAPIGCRLDEPNPMVNARLPDGGHINVVIPPLVLEEPVVSIRKSRKDPLKPGDLLGLGMMSEETEALIDSAMRARCNILVSGGTNSGKTSLLNAMACHVPTTERVITIEDTAEPSLNHPHVVRLRSQPDGFEGTGVVTIRGLLRNSLRMRPDRIIVGEVRDGGVSEMLQATSIGHDGLMDTIRASSPRECLYRLEMLAGFTGLQSSEAGLRRQTTSAISFIVWIGRLSSGKRRILSITEVTELGGNITSTQELYRYEPYIGPDGEEVDRWTALGLQPHSPKLVRMRNSEDGEMDGGMTGFGGGGRLHV